MFKGTEDAPKSISRLKLLPHAMKYPNTLMPCLPIISPSAIIRQMIKYSVAIAIAAKCSISFGQTALNLDFSYAIGSYTQNFDTLASSGTANTTVPSGWAFIENPGNTTYSTGNGSNNAGNTYSFGSSSDRAFGGLQSGSVNPIIGAAFTNAITGLVIVDVQISYTGEQWRLGATGRTDRLDFQYSTTATGLNAGAFSDFNDLDFTAPVSSGTTGALDGNVNPNRSSITGTVSGLDLSNGQTLRIRWNDLDASGADDGLALDDFSLKITKLGTAGLNVGVNTLAAPASLIIQNGHATNASTLTATIASNETFSGVLQNGAGGSLGLTKAGVGELTLSGANVHTGLTTISAGSLKLGASNAISASKIVLNGGSLLTSGFENTTTGSLSLTSSSTINLAGAGSKLVFADSSAETWTGTLTVWNWSAGALKFGTSDTGLTTSGPGNQLSQIQVFSGPGSGQLFDVSLASDGTLVAVPEVGALFGALGLLAPLAWRERRHWMRCREARVA
jgi:autotransporter-associated beta strand protein